jgi:hypothetical protein
MKHKDHPEMLKMIKDRIIKLLGQNNMKVEVTTDQDSVQCSWKINKKERQRPTKTDLNTTYEDKEEIELLHITIVQIEHNIWSKKNSFDFSIQSNELNRNCSFIEISESFKIVWNNTIKKRMNEIGNITTTMHQLMINPEFKKINNDYEYRREEK